ncbi:MAG: GPR endopeptidase, partial [Clostridia bacterium]|nr:GPR endopeptidase [Clostridia bacterium]
PSLWSGETVRELKAALSGELSRLSPAAPPVILAVGLGNRGHAADLFGCAVCDGLCATGHLPVQKPELFRSLRCRSLFVFSPGVMGQTGFETAALVKKAVDLAKPDLVLQFDSLATLSPGHLLRTLQLTDTGVTPGGGVGNQRLTLTPEFLGVPTVGVGVPTVISACVLAGKEDETISNLYVSPKDADTQLPLLCRLVYETLNELYSLSLSPFSS